MDSGFILKSKPYLANLAHYIVFLFSILIVSIAAKCKHSTDILLPFRFNMATLLSSVCVTTHPADTEHS